METKLTRLLKVARAQLAVENGGKFTQGDMAAWLNQGGLDIKRGTYASWESGFSVPSHKYMDKVMELVKKKVNTE